MTAYQLYQQVSPWFKRRGARQRLGQPAELPQRAACSPSTQAAARVKSRAARRSPCVPGRRSACIAAVRSTENDRSSCSARREARAPRRAMSVATAFPTTQGVPAPGPRCLACANCCVVFASAPPAPVPRARHVSAPRGARRAIAPARRATRARRHGLRLPMPHRPAACAAAALRRRRRQPERREQQMLRRRVHLSFYRRRFHRDAGLRQGPPQGRRLVELQRHGPGHELPRQRRDRRARPTPREPRAGAGRARRPRDAEHADEVHALGRAGPLPCQNAAARFLSACGEREPSREPSARAEQSMKMSIDAVPLSQQR